MTDPLLEALNRLKQEHERMERLNSVLKDFSVDGMSAQEILNRFQNLNNNTTQRPPTLSHATPKWKTLAEMNASLAHLPKRPSPPKINPEVRKRQIEDELDIIRGITPTPKGYKIDTTKVKALVAEYNRL